MDAADDSGEAMEGHAPGLPRVCVVGAGPAGLAAIRALLRHGAEVVCFERHTDLGGIWDQENQGSPVYDSAHFISSKTLSGFHGFPMPDDFPDYPTHRQVLSYLRSFADAYGLRDSIRFDSEVSSARPLEGGGWQVELADGSVHGFDHLVCANGTTWDPSPAEFPGEFGGRILHSSDYRSAESLRGRRVLVVGAGNSGVDIACDAAQTAEAAWISLRRGYWFVPKHIFGKPADVFAESGPELPMPLAQRILPAVIRMQVGRPERYGLPAPDHRLFESHPIVNSQILHHLSHGDIAVKPNVERYEGQSVVFTDGSSEEIGVVVLATGYRFSIPYLPDGLVPFEGNRPQLYMHLFARSREDLYGIGFTEGDGGGYGLFDEMADLIATAITAGPEGRRELRRAAESGEQPDFSGGVRHLRTDRHAAYVHLPAYRKQVRKLRDRLGWEQLDPEQLSPETAA